MKMADILQMGRKHCGKRRNYLLRAISPFPTVFSKDMSCRHVKTRACLGNQKLDLLQEKMFVEPGSMVKRIHGLQAGYQND